MPTDELAFTPGDDRWTALRERCLTDLFFFASVVLGFPNVFPMHAETHLLFCRFLERKTGIPDLDQAPIQKCETPRGTGKTTLGTVASAIQESCRNPNIAILIANERQETADGFLRAIKTQFETNDLLRALFPEVIPPDFGETTWAISKATLKRTSRRPEPTFTTIGVGGTVTGTHPDIIIVDDPVSKEAMENARVGAWQIMERVNRWCNELKYLLNPQALPMPWIRFNGTRWWRDDTYDYIEKKYGYEEQPRRYRLSAKMADGLVVSREVYRVGDVAIFRAAGIEHGRPTYPDIYPMAKLIKLQRDDPELFACLPPGEMIQTKDGPQPIEAAAGLALTRGGEYKPIVANSMRPYQGTMVRLWFYGQAHPATMTANHKLWLAPVRAKVTKWQENWMGNDGEYDWIRADEVKRGDLAEIPVHDAHWTPDGREGDPDFWFLVGHFIGDGTINKQGAVSHCFNKNDRVLAERVAGIVRRLYGRKARIYEKRTTVNLTYRHPDSAAFFGAVRRHGLSQKWLDAKYERLELSLQRQLVDGYWLADGCELSGGDRMAAGVCLPWLCQLQRILARLGIAAHLVGPRPNTTTIEGRSVNAQPLYNLSIHINRKRRPNKAWIDNGKMYRRVRKLEHFAYDGPVFNCEVEDEHSYVAATNAVVYANCNIQNNPTDAAIRTFQDSWLRYYDWVDPHLIGFRTDDGGMRHVRADDLSKIMIVDPAFTASGSGSRAAILVIGSDLHTGKRLVLEAKAQRADPKDLVDDIINIAQRHRVRRLFIEAVGAQAGFIAFVQTAVLARNIPIAVETVKPGGRNKDVRIEGLAAYFKAGTILIHPAQLDLIAEYRSYTPGARLKDVLDALAYGPELWPTVSRPGTRPADRTTAELRDYYARRGFPQQAADVAALDSQW